MGHANHMFGEELGGSGNVTILHQEGVGIHPSVESIAIALEALKNIF